jgi:predicted O-linked N-acetylglucosamine transferase (SPINDLY family)
LRSDPRNFELHNNRGLTLQAMGRHEDAAASFTAALAARPDWPDAHNNRGITLRALGRYREALADFEQVLTHQPRNVAALLNRAAALFQLGRAEEALHAYDAALTLDPAHAGARSSRGALRARLKDTSGAITDLEEALQLAPDQPWLRGSLLHVKMEAGDWRDLDTQLAALHAAVRASQPAAEPFAYQALCDDPAALQQCARVFAATNFPAPPARPPLAARPQHIRIGYVCGEFRNQATMILSAGLYEAHDRSRLEVIAIDNGQDDGSPMRQRLMAAFDQVIPIAGLSEREAAKVVADAGIHVLVNLNGYFGNMRMGLFTARPAPIQVNYLGFPGTLGSSAMDYIIADHIVIPDGDRAFFDEAVVRLPGSYQINDNRRSRPAPASRVAHGLPESGFVFCNFNFNYKIAPGLFAVWMRLLMAVPGSVLWLLSEDALFADNLRKAAAARGVDPQRLVFAAVVSQDEHLARLALADLVLDTLPYNAHTTGSDALWMGVPLLTCRGKAFAGRVAASLLTATGLPELITDDLAAYEALALRLARAPGELAGLRTRLTKARTAAPLFDTVRTTRYLEAAYDGMIAQALRGETPSAFDVPA